MSKLWFKAKQYGWGWYPVTWQGWLVTIGYIFLVLENSMRISKSSESANNALILHLVYVFFLTALLIFICYKKGEKPQWRWGNKK